MSYGIVDSQQTWCNTNCYMSFSLKVRVTAWSEANELLYWQWSARSELLICFRTWISAQNIIINFLNVAKVKYVTLQVDVYSLHFSLMQRVLWFIMRNAKLGLVCKHAQQAWLLRAHNMLFSSETFSGGVNCFCWEDSKIRGRHKGELWHGRKKRPRILSLSWLWLFEFSLSSAVGHTQTWRHRHARMQLPKNTQFKWGTSWHFSIASKAITARLLD